jgi:hypothetical protein
MKETDRKKNLESPVYVFTWYVAGEASPESRKNAIEFVTRQMDDNDYEWWEIKYIRRWRNPLDYFETGYRIRVRWKEKGE